MLFKGISVLLLLSLSIVAGASSSGQWKGAVPFPEKGVGKAYTKQLRIQFPEQMEKTAEAFEVTCKPAMAGAPSWGLEIRF